MDLVHVATQNIPWVAIGDFNAIVGSHEKRGRPSPLNISYNEFVAFTDACDFVHMDALGEEFTWTNGRKGRGHTDIHLDRAVCNVAWYTVWTDTACRTLGPSPITAF